MKLFKLATTVVLIAIMAILLFDSEKTFPVKKLLSSTDFKLKRTLENCFRFLSKQTQHFQQLEVLRYRVVPKISSINKLKIAQISDIHYSHENPPNLAKQIEKQLVDAIRIEKPDYIVITGDFVHYSVSSSHDMVENILKPISAILESVHPKKQLRIFGVLGNHDLMDSKRMELKQILERDGLLKILDNEYHFDKENNLVFVGLPDCNEDNFDPQRIVKQLIQNHQITNNTTHIVLSHVPDSASCLILKDSSQRYNCTSLQSDIMLSGHTHATQIKVFGMNFLQLLVNYLPFNLAGKLFRRAGFSTNAVKNWNWIEGLFETNDNTTELLPLKEGSTLYLNQGKSYLNINRGLGGHFGLRINCNPELTILEFE